MTNVSAIRRHLDEYFIMLTLIALIVFFCFASENFYSSATLSSILNQLPPLILVTVGITLVMLVGGIDLSVGSLLALSATITGSLFVSHGVPLSLAAFLGIVAALAIGTISGWLTSYMRMPSFIVTLGVLEAARGLAYLVSSSRTVYIGPDIQYLTLPVSGIGLSPAFLVALGVVAVAQLVLSRTVVGRHLIAIGTSEPASHVSGIRIRPYRLGVLAVSGLLAGVAGLFNASYLAAADPNAGVGLELSAIAAAVIGGSSLMGGRGTVVGAFIGVLIIAVLQSGLAQIGVSEPVKRLVTGAVIILAVLVDQWRSANRRDGSTRSASALAAGA